MFRTTPPYGGGSERNHVILQLNEAAKGVMAELGIPIFRWSDFLVGTGSEEYRRYADGNVDNLHFRTGCKRVRERMPAYISELTFF